MPDTHDTHHTLATAALIRLSDYGLLRATGADAQAFLHAQLTNSIEGLSPERAVQAGWCTAKGRLLATLLVVPVEGGLLLQLAADLAQAVRKRLAMFILRAKVKLDDESSLWAQYGIQGDGAKARLQNLGLPVPDAVLGVGNNGRRIVVAISASRFMVLLPATEAEQFEQLAGMPGQSPAAPEAWALEEIRAGRPLVTAATQELFVPQMLNLHELGAIDFKKGCYPGQEIVARTQYRGELKRRMVRARLNSEETLAPGQPLYSDALPGQESGTVVNATRDGTDWEMLAVVPVPLQGEEQRVRTAPEGSVLSIAGAGPAG